MYLLFYLKVFLPGRVAQSVGHWIRKSGVLGTILGLATYFRFSFCFFKKVVVSFWRKYVHEVLVDRLGGLSLPMKSVVRFTDRSDMTLDVHRGRKTTMQQIEGISKSILLNSILNFAILSISNVRNVIIWHSLVVGAAISSQQEKGLAHRAPQCPPPLPPPKKKKTFLRLCLEPHICIGSHPLPSTDLMGFSPISFVPFILFYYFFIKQQVLLNQSVCRALKAYFSRNKQKAF